MGNFIKKWSSPGEAGQLVGACAGTPRGAGFDSRSGHVPRLRVPSLVWEQLINVSLTPMFLSLPLSLKSMNISLGEDLKKEKRN